jgi:DNA-binding PadR family transcriptional regulator
MNLLSRNEELLLITVWKLGDGAYSISVQDRMSELLGRRVSIGAVYVPLERMVRRGFLSTRESEPTEQRGGRRKRFYRLTTRGVAALSAVERVTARAWKGISLPDAELQGAKA